MKKIKNFKAFFESKINESSLKSGGIYYYYTSFDDPYAIPGVYSYDLNIPFDEEASEWDLPHLTPDDLYNEYFHRNVTSELNMNKFLEEVDDAMSYDEDYAIERIDELLNEYELEEKYSAEEIVNDPEYRKIFYKNVASDRKGILDEIKQRRFKVFKEKLYPYDSVWNFIVAGEINPCSRLEALINSTNLYSALKSVSCIKDGVFIILAYCREEDNFHILNQDNTFADTGIRVETTEKSEEDEIARILSDLEISDDIIFISSLPTTISKKIYDRKGLPHNEIDSIVHLRDMGLL
jgi:hypothetical protein